MCCDYAVDGNLPQAAKIRESLMSDSRKNMAYLYVKIKSETCLWIIFLFILREFYMLVCIKMTAAREGLTQ